MWQWTEHSNDLCCWLPKLWRNRNRRKRWHTVHVNGIDSSSSAATRISELTRAAIHIATHKQIWKWTKICCLFDHGACNNMVTCAYTLCACAILPLNVARAKHTRTHRLRLRSRLRGNYLESYRRLKRAATKQHRIYGIRGRCVCVCVCCWTQLINTRNCMYIRFQPKHGAEAKKHNASSKWRTPKPSNSSSVLSEMKEITVQTAHKHTHTQRIDIITSTISIHFRDEWKYNSNNKKEMRALKELRLFCFSCLVFTWFCH